MQVYVNDTAVIIFQGATALDAVRRYCTDTGATVEENQLFDAWGNPIAPDSPMSESRCIYTAKPL